MATSVDSRFVGLRLKPSEEKLALDLAEASLRSPSSPFRYLDVDQWIEHSLAHPGLSGLRDRALFFEIRNLARHGLLDITGDNRRGEFVVSQIGLDYAAFLRGPVEEVAKREIVDRSRLGDQRKKRLEIDPKGTVIGESPALLKLFEEIALANVSGADSPVLLLGERGVGKTHIAKLLHDASDRSSRPFEKVNAGSAGGDLNMQRSEWFGCGPNSGLQGIPKEGRKGHFQDVEGGSLFVDEFDAMSIELQANFLSVLEGHGIQQVGGRTVTPAVRCIFATNADLEAAVKEGRLRRDLLDRIGRRIVVPPLRERIGDVPALASHFADQLDSTLEDRCHLALLRHDWPGNVRELRQVIEGAAARAKGQRDTQIRLEYLGLPDAVLESVRGIDSSAAHDKLWRVVDQIARDEGFELGSGLQKRAAEILGVSAGQASKMYEKLGLSQLGPDPRS
jgi:DNA-binding NtrC family response regulator